MHIRNVMTPSGKLGKMVNGAVILRDWLGEGGKTVEPELAQSRALVCIACPLNVKSAIVIGAVADAIKRQVEVKNALQLRVKGERSLGKCSVCLCEMRLKIWLPIERITPQPGDVFDPRCWLLSETTPPQHLSEL